VGIELTDPLENRRVSRENARQALREEHVRRLFRIGRHESRALRMSGNLDQRIPQPLRVARELYAGGIREPLPLA